MLRRELTVALAFVLSFTSVAFGRGRDVNEHDEVIVTPVSERAPTAIDIENRLGDVSVRGWDRHEVRISARKIAPDEATLDRMKIRVITLPDGSLRISSVIEAGANEAGVEGKSAVWAKTRVDLDIRVPRDAHMVVRGQRGDLSATGLHGGLVLETSEGGIDVTDASGKIATRTVHGRQTFDVVRGEVQVWGATSDVELDEVSGRSLSARTADGRISARQISSNTVVLESALGNVEFHGTIPAGAHLRLRSYGGDVRAVVRQLSPIDVVARGRGVEALRDVVKGGDLIGARLTGRLEPAARSGAKRAKLELFSAEGQLTLAFGK